MGGQALWMPQAAGENVDVIRDGHARTAEASQATSLRVRKPLRWLAALID